MSFCNIIEQWFRAEKTLLSDRINNEHFIINLATVPGRRNSISPPAASRKPLAEIMNQDYRAYHNIENYIRGKVCDRFHKDGFIGAADFFCIVIWKANRAKSKIANNLIKREPNLELSCKKLTAKLFKLTSQKEKLYTLIKEYGFRLPMSTAILSVLYPHDFCVYDFRVCETLEGYSDLNNLTNFEKIWNGYSKYVQEVKNTEPINLSLVDKDHYLWGKSFYSQLKKDISSNFNIQQ